MPVSADDTSVIGMLDDDVLISRTEGCVQPERRCAPRATVSWQIRSV